MAAHPDNAADAGPGASLAIHDTGRAASEAVALEIAELIRRRAAEGRPAVLGLATGSTPQRIYDELVRLHHEDGLSFAGVVTFNLDEYWPMDPGVLQSYHRFMHELLFDHVDIDPRNTHIPDGTVSAQDAQRHCEDLENRIRAAGGIDYQILGVGRTGHIGFNEPGSGRRTRARVITLDKVTRLDAAGDFFGEANVPRQALTLGVGTIFEARKVVLVAFGEQKSEIIRQAFEGPVCAQVPCSFLQEHPDATFMLDSAAASELTPCKTPWLLAPMAHIGRSWDDATTRRAVIWLARKLEKPILKLVVEDYNEQGLQELLAVRGSAYEINIEVFKALQRTITGWPGGKPGGAAPFPKRVVVFSPHPDDDVISMGGTLIRLCEQGHDVHVAYQTSGNIAVFDDEAVRHADFVSAFCHTFDLFSREEVERIEDTVRSFVQKKTPGEIDSPSLQRIKTLIRRTEARAAARYCGVHEERIHFLDMPFYETGRVRKRPLAAEDIAIIADLLDRVRPNQLYAAGDLSDPHGTHRACLAAVTAAIRRLQADGSSWISESEVWHYRGAWQEWGPHEIDMAVPLSPDEVDRKRSAIFKHESQKDKALFPGPSDVREFWKRAEDRNRNTAELYDRLGLPEYQAIEAFVRWRP